jgi:hypothetical protein
MEWSIFCFCVQVPLAVIAFVRILVCLLSLSGFPHIFSWICMSVRDLLIFSRATCHFINLHFDHWQPCRFKDLFSALGRLLLPDLPHWFCTAAGTGTPPLKRVATGIEHSHWNVTNHRYLHGTMWNAPLSSPHAFRSPHAAAAAAPNGTAPPPPLHSTHAPSFGMRSLGAPSPHRPNHASHQTNASSGHAPQPPAAAATTVATTTTHDELDEFDDELDELDDEALLFAPLSSLRKIWDLDGDDPLLREDFPHAVAAQYADASSSTAGFNNVTTTAAASLEFGRGVFGSICGGGSGLLSDAGSPFASRAGSDSFGMSIFDCHYCL